MVIVLIYYPSYRSTIGKVTEAISQQYPNVVVEIDLEETNDNCVKSRIDIYGSVEMTRGRKYPCALLL